MPETRTILIYCDGACSGNQSRKNRGGWGCVLVCGDLRRELRGAEADTTNQRMELLACIKALEAVKSRGIPIEVRSDSAYLVNCMNQKWFVRWRRNGWMNSQKKPVDNQDLWKRLLSLVERLPVAFRKVSGHSGVELNERADELAREAIAELGG
jgi:ribonuclease HI